MERDSSGEKYIPYKFYDSSKDNETIVHCRGVTSGTYRQFSLGQKSWLIVDPFTYPGETEDEIVESLQKIFKTNYVYTDDGFRYLVKDYDLTDFKESHFKNVIFLSDIYTIKIVMNNNRFYNLFSTRGEWLETRGHEYPNMQRCHVLIKYDDINDHLLYKRVSSSDYQILIPREWDITSESTDIVFSTIDRRRFEDLIGSRISTRIDYVYVSKYWIDEDSMPLDKWYTKNINSLYELSFLSSRNLSDILEINSSKEWDIITEDILLSHNTSIYNATKVERLNNINYYVVGKYRNLYMYKLSDFLLRLMENSGCKLTLATWALAKSLSKWKYIIQNLFNNSKLEPLNFVIPDNCVYLDDTHVVTTYPLEGGFNYIKKVEYMIILGEGSYLMFNSNTKESYFQGRHPLTMPLFPAVKRSIENYMLCNYRNFDVNIEAIADLTDKNKNSLQIDTIVTRSNLSTFESIIPDTVLRDFNLGKITRAVVPIWLHTNSKKMSSTYNSSECNKASTNYIINILQSIDNVAVRFKR